VLHYVYCNFAVQQCKVNAMQNANTNAVVYYSKNANFYEQFDAGTFELEDTDGRVWTGLIDGVVAAQFVHDKTGDGGYGWWDETLL